jgi:ubiquinone biosynthesis protein
LGLAIKNVGRAREVAAAMVRFGFGQIVEQLGFEDFFLSRLLLRRSKEEDYSLPERIRMLCEELGPTFIKFGQILAGRPDLIPADWVPELSKLQDHVSPVSIHEIKPVIESDLGGTLDQFFSSFDTEPLATASIAQVHTARTLEGDEVVVKVKKPNVERLLAQDLQIVETLATLAEHYVEELKPFRPSNIIREFKKSLLNEIDFRKEATSMRRYRKNFENSDFLVIPRVYADLSSDNVLTQERLRGVKLSDIESVKSLGVDTTLTLERGMDAFFKSIMEDGFFHGDPHGGNILVLPDGRMGLLDFGNMGSLSPKSKDAIINMFLALVAEDYDSLVLEYLYLSPPSPGSRSSTKIDTIQREVAAQFSQYRGLPLKEIPSGKILLDASSVAFKYHVSLPQDLIAVFKSIMTLEGIGRQLDPNFDLLSSGTAFAGRLLKQRYAPEAIGKDLLLFGRDLSRFLRSTPRQLGEVIRQVESGELRVHLSLDHIGKDFMRAQSHSANKISMALLSLGLMGVSATLSVAHPNLPLWTEISIWALTGLCTLRSLWISIRY